MKPVSKILRAVIVVTFGLGTNHAARSDEDEYSAVHTVSIISLLGNQLLVQNAPYQRLGYKSSVLTLEWDLDAYAVQQVATEISGRFVVLTASLDPKLFEEAHFGGVLSSNAMNQIANLPIQQRADAYVVIYPAVLEPGPGAIALTQEQPAWKQTTILTNLIIDVIDGRTGKRIDHGSGHDPVARCDDDIWAPNADSYSDVQKKSIEFALKDMLNQNLSEALYHANLISDSAGEKSKSDASKQSKAHACHLG